MNDEPLPEKLGALSYSCVFYSHQFCDGTAEHHDEDRHGAFHWTDCVCPCHHPDTTLKAA